MVDREGSSLNILNWWFVIWYNQEIVILFSWYRVKSLLSGPHIKPTLSIKRTAVQVPYFFSHSLQ